MKAFCVKYDVFASIRELEGVAELYRVSDGYLSDYKLCPMIIAYRGQYLMD